MNSSRPDDADLPLDLARKLDRICSDFERAWKAGERPEIDAFLPDDDRLRAVALEHLVHVDLEQQLKADASVRVESYFDRYPQLVRTGDVAVELIVAEYLLLKDADGPIDRN